MGKKYIVKEMIGKRVFNIKCNEWMEIIEWENAQNIKIKFESGGIHKCSYHQLKKGTIKNLNIPSVYEHGYIGYGDHKAFINSKMTFEYITWRNMLKRCYNKSSLIQRPTYKNCKVCEEWKNFQIFAEWVNNYNGITKGYDLDKDIIDKNSKIYNEKNCIFIPAFLNSLIHRTYRHKKLPLGVSYDKEKKKYESYCQNENGKKYHLGYYKSIDEAFYQYKKYKEYLIKKNAIEYKNKISVIAYEALMNYEVEITD